MRHLGWLHATPEGATKSRFKSFKESNEDSQELKLPDVGDADYLVQLLYEAGLVNQNGMGASPLTWQEIESWLDTLFSYSTVAYKYDGCGVYIPYTAKESSLSTWEKLTLREMSEAYSNEYSQASDKNRPIPYLYMDEEFVIDRPAVASKLTATLRSLMK